VESPEDFESQN